MVGFAFLQTRVPCGMRPRAPICQLRHSVQEIGAHQVQSVSRGEVASQRQMASHPLGDDDEQEVFAKGRIKLSQPSVARSYLKARPHLTHSATMKSRKVSLKGASSDGAKAPM
eukprot:6174036-Pleurochrysis_carterae.AAC.4